MHWFVFAIAYSGRRVGRSSYQAGPIQNTNFKAREILFREKNVIKQYKIKNTFIIPTDAHYYTNHRMLKQF